MKKESEDAVLTLRGFVVSVFVLSGVQFVHGDSPYTLVLENDSAAVGDAVESTVFLEFEPGADVVTGISFSVCHDASVVGISCKAGFPNQCVETSTIVQGVDLMATNNGMGAAFFAPTSQTIPADGYSVAMVVNLLGEDSLPNTGSAEISIATYQALATGVSPLSVCKLGSPLVLLSVGTSGIDFIPRAVNGSIEVSQTEVRLTDAAGPSGTVQTVSAFFDVVGTPLNAWSFAICHDPNRVSVVGVAAGAALAGFGPPADFINVEIEPDDSVSMGAALAPPFFGPGGDLEILNIEYSLDGPNGTQSTVEYCEAGVPLVLIFFLDGNGNQFLPPQTGGTVTIDSVAAQGDLDNGETSVLNPSGASNDPTESVLVEITNVSGPDDASVTATATDEDLHPGAGGFAVFDTQLTVLTSLSNGAFLMRVSMPFSAADLAGADPLSVDLTFFDPNTGNWTLAVEGNTARSPGHMGRIGDRFAEEGLSLPSLSSDLGDHGVFWNRDTQRGFAWANVDHATDFAPGTPLGPNLIRADTDGDGIFNALVDGLYLLEFQFSAGPTPPCLEAAEVDGDGVLNGLVDTLYLLTHGFLSGPPPSAPYPECGRDPAPDTSLGCDSHPGCD